MQLDQPWINGAARCGDGDSGKFQGQWRTRWQHRHDLVTANADGAVGDDPVAGIHRYDASPVNAQLLVLRAGPHDVLGASQMSVWRSSGMGRDTLPACGGIAVRRHASSPRNGGAPKGRSRRGIGA